uniref:Uncharacterized protein n=1 Tax=Lotus japonicus TaxID=34305 RepID=I3SCF6_LOTJA|nr:unknown [Lotus japonicus]
MEGVPKLQVKSRQRSQAAIDGNQPERIAKESTTSQFRKMSLADWFTTVHPSGETRVGMLEQEPIAIASGGRMVYID